ncbi:hypothetical protein, partial [uncultured Photobacterium sp.]|uniref:hypothetical protein n=1 Tax=uncultured Photobacterium sp. TaxID=173973 RepID=UPI00262965DC
RYTSQQVVLSTLLIKGIFMSPNDLFSEGLSKLAAIQISENSSPEEKLFAEGLTRTLAALHSEILTLREKVQELEKKN